MGRKIAVSIDGSSHADYAVEYYLNFVARPEDEVTLFHCVQPYVLYGPGKLSSIHNLLCFLISVIFCNYNLFYFMNF